MYKSIVLEELSNLINSYYDENKSNRIDDELIYCVKLEVFLAIARNAKDKKMKMMINSFIQQISYDKSELLIKEKWYKENTYDSRNKSDEVRTMCREFIFKSPKLSVDMSKYNKLIADNHDLLLKNGILKQLVNYCDDRTVLNKICSNVQSDIYCAPVSQEDFYNKSLMFELVKKSFNKHYREIIRLADNYIESKIDSIKYM